MSGIEWTEKTWNPITGCTKVSAGCKNCYAEGMAHRFWGDRSFSEIQFHEERLEIPLKREKPTTWFVNSMSDLFHGQIYSEWLEKILGVMILTPQHKYQVLTKRPEQMFRRMTEETLLGARSKAVELTNEFPSLKNTIGAISNPLPNLYLGVSVENQKAANDRIALLLRTPAAMRFLSCEPLLEEITVMPWLERSRETGSNHQFSDRSGARGRIHLVICGGESGHKARPFDVNWARSLQNECRNANVSFFMKQVGSNANWEAQGKGNLIGELPKDLQIREYPKINDYATT